jgi:hypothetical protein
VCQLWAHLLGRGLTVVNCHQRSETADFLGAFRPAPSQERARGRLFSWADGPWAQLRPMHIRSDQRHSDELCGSARTVCY